MNLNFLFMDGYGIYVWSAFLFTFIFCLGLYIKTKKTLKKLEKEFIVVAESLSQKKLKELKTTKIAKEILASQTKVN